MKNSFFLTLISIFLFASCGGSSAQETENTVPIEKVKLLDSLSNDMDNVAKEIEVNTKALEDALSELDEEF